MKEINKKELIDKLAAAGGFYGYSKPKRHSSVKAFIDSNKNGKDIINLEKTAVQVEEACKFLASLIADKKQVLFVGTKAEAREKVRNVGLMTGQPFAAERFIGGTFTNFGEIRKRVQKLADLQDKKERGEFAVYTKKENVMIDRDIARMTKNFGGLATLGTAMPAALIVVDPKAEEVVVKEAEYARIPVIALANTDCNIKKVQFPIVMNDASAQSIGVVLDYIKEALQSVE
jgi:small subunit ribosomal protein S2